MFIIVTSVISILVVLTGWGLDYYIPAGMRSAYGATTGLWFGFLLLWITACGTFSSRDLLKANAEWIGTKNTLVARVACILGMLLAIGQIVMSILRLFHRL